MPEKLCYNMLGDEYMKEIRYQDILKMDKYWIFYRDPEAGQKHVDLDACANSFARATDLPADNDGLRCVGYRYRHGNTVYYELFTIGHLRIRCGGLMCLFDKDAGMKLEQHLNASGYKTVEK